MQYPLHQRACTFKMIFYVCILLIICGVDATRSVKGLYCQDPDTKKLYPVNATWQSETFCGNYTCKLRKINHTQTEYTPITKINITDMDINKGVDDMSTSPSEQNVITKLLQEDKRPVFNPNSLENLNQPKEVNLNKVDDNNDRYLTEIEIKSITDILHTVKKSDLEAIVEIYNLAQDIYKEAEGVTTENQVKETKPINVPDKDKINDFKSYFYKPLHQIHMELNSTEMKKEDAKPLPTRHYRQPLSYFNGPLTDKDFGKVPYYYPMSNFHRTYPPYSYNRPYTTPAVPPTRPCTNKPPANFLQLPWYDRTLIRPYVRPQHPTPSRPMLLPYPFSYVHNYNNNAYPASFSSFYYNNYPWAQLHTYNKRGYFPYFGYVAQNPIVDTEPEPIKEKESVDESKDDIKTGGENTLPEWQTEPLPATVLEEVKANILQKSKLLKPSGKSVKLERVGKVIKLDELAREKRHVITDNKTDVEEIEAYLVSTTCEPSTEPGFFRVGNLSAPYPACCPQKIRQTQIKT